MSFSNKVVIVTGASSGIGAATAKRFGKEGADVVVVGRNQEKLKNVEEQLKKLGKAPLIITADVAKDDEAKRVIKETIDKYGKLDVLVNNAGIMAPASILDGTILKSYDDIIRLWNALPEKVRQAPNKLAFKTMVYKLILQDSTPTINLRAVVHLTSLAAPHLAKTKGNIVNISSIAGTSLLPNLIAYCTSKAGLNHFSRGAASELAAHGVRVNVVSPGPVVTDIVENAGIDPNFDWESGKAFTALKRVSQPEEIADLIAFLASDAAKGITGSEYVTDNGAKLI